MVKALTHIRTTKLQIIGLITVLLFTTAVSYAQRTIRIGYIDTEYILENVPEYQEASVQLDDKIKRWQSEVQERLSALEEKRKQLNNERVLLTKELFEERQEELNIEQTEILEYQQKRFGPNGDMMIQKKQLMQPIQDQIFNAVQEIATARNYDFVFDKSADVVMLYSADRFDISDQVLRSINRSSKRRQATTRAERQAAEDETLIPEEPNPAEQERLQAIEDKKAERAKLVEDRRQKQLEAREAKRKELEAKKQAVIDAREKARQEKLNARNQDTAKTVLKDTVAGVVKDSTKTTPPKPMTDRERRKKALEDKKKKILEERKKKREAELKARQKRKDSTQTKDNE